MPIVRPCASVLGVSRDAFSPGIVILIADLAASFAISLYLFLSLDATLAALCTIAAYLLLSYDAACQPLIAIADDLLLSFDTACQSLIAIALYLLLSFDATFAALRDLLLSCGALNLTRRSDFASGACGSRAAFLADGGAALLWCVPSAGPAVSRQDRFARCRGQNQDDNDRDDSIVHGSWIHRVAPVTGRTLA